MANEIYKPGYSLPSHYDTGAPPYPVRPGSDRNEGLLLKLSRISGVTKKGFLNEPYFFQCPPLDEFSIPRGHDRSTYTTLRKGQFSRSAGRVLRTFPLDTLVVTWAPWILGRDQNGDIGRMQRRLEVLAERAVVVRFQASHAFGTSGGGVNWADFPITIKRFTPTEKGGENDTRYFNLEIEEWRDQMVDTKGKKRSGGRDFPRTHTLDNNDTLHSLTEKYYGSVKGWQLIAGVNNIWMIGPNYPIVKSKRWKKGDKIKIPKPAFKEK